MFSLAATDQNIIHRCVAASQHPPTGRPEFDVPATLQRIFFLRVWLGKTFEIVESVDGIKRNDLIADEKLKPVFLRIHADADLLKKDTAYKVALRLRNESSFHYGYKSMQKNCVNIDPASNCNIHWGKRAVNSYFPMGDEVAFGRALSNHLAEPEAEGGFRELLEALTSWGLAGSKWVRKSHSTLVAELLSRDVESPECVEHTLEELATMVGPVGPHLPVFFADDGQMS